jgi:thiamine-monophosphate kinase
VLEFDLINHIRQASITRTDVPLGIGDDCALLAPPPGMQLAVTMDTLNIRVHFPPETVPFDIGWKALAVNLSDLAAMGAQPAWCTLSLSLPEATSVFIDGFAEGFLTLAAQYHFALVGGDTTRGPLSISVTAMGFVEANQALRRDGAKRGDDIWISGTLGDAAAALKQWQAGAATAALRERLDRPTPRVALGRALRGIANSCVDISDGLLADLAHICRASGVAAKVDAAALPASDALKRVFPERERLRLQATGGDDYELCFTAASDKRDALQALAHTLQLPLTRIGKIESGKGVHCDDVAASAGGYQHFA